MLHLEMPLNDYEKLNHCLSEIHPEILLNLVACDQALASLGFVESPSCVIEVNSTNDELDKLLGELMLFEIATVDMPCQSKEYQLLVKYGWMWDVLILQNTLNHNKLVTYGASFSLLSYLNTFR